MDEGLQFTFLTPLIHLYITFISPPERRTSDAQNEASYICDACGEEIVIPLDLSEGVHQTYVEDCPVCCRASTIHVEMDGEGNAKVWAEPEQDRE